MCVVSLTLEDSNRSILSPSYYKIIQDVVDAIKIPFGTLVVLHKDTETTLTDNRINTSTQEKVNLPSTVAKRRIHATITEEYNEDELTTTAIHQPSAYPIFQDREVSVSVYPIYVKSDISIEFTYTSPSKIEANRIRDDIRLRLSQTRNIDIHEIEYSILIPEVVEEFIADVYDLKNRLVPQSLETYFKEHSSNRVYPITDMSNESNSKLAMHEKQVRILGLFDFSSMPEKLEIDNDNNNYKLSFTYKISMDVPRAIALRYPVMICNKLLPSKYISFIQDHKVNSKQEYKKLTGYTSDAIRNLSNFESHRQLEYRTDINLPVNIPLFDDFNLREGHRGYAILASFLTDVNETDKKSLFNLNEIDPYQLPQVLVDYIIAEELPYITSPYQSILYLGLHQEGRFFDSDILSIDSNLNVKARRELSLFKPNRVTLSFCIDFSMLHSSVMLRLFKHPEILLLFINEYIEIIKNYKTEVNINYVDNTFYRVLMDIILYFHKTDDNDVICGLLQIIQKDKYTEQVFSKQLYVGYNDLYNELKKNNILYIDRKNYKLTKLCGNTPEEQSAINAKLNNTFSKDVDIKDILITDNNVINARTSVAVMAMKTVTTARVIAYKMEDINR